MNLNNELIAKMVLSIAELKKQFASLNTESYASINSAVTNSVLHPSKILKTDENGLITLAEATIGDGSTGSLNIGSTGWYDDGTYFSPISSRTFYIRSNVAQSYLYSASIYLGSGAGSETTIRTRGNSLRVGENSANQSADLVVTNFDAGTYDPIKFYYKGTRVGEIGAGDSTWLRLNSTTVKNIYTPRMFRADGGFQVGNWGGDFIVNSSGYVGINNTNPTEHLHIKTANVDITSYTHGIDFYVDTTGGWARAIRFSNKDDLTNESVAFGALTGEAFISAGFDQAADSTGYTTASLKVGADGVGILGSPQTGSALSVAGRIRPIGDNLYDLGTSLARWDDIYATNSTILTSDRNNKDNIEDCDLGLAFIRQLKPKSYKWKDYSYTEEKEVLVQNEDGEIEKQKTETVEHEMKFVRRHYGLIAQEVEEVLGDKDFAGLVKSEAGYGLRYNEFLAPMIAAMQEMSQSIDEMGAKIKSLEAEVQALKSIGG